MSSPVPEKRERKEFDDQDQPHCSGRERFGGGRGGKHPPHLKGKQIGLFYARKNKLNQEDQIKKPLGTVSLSKSKICQIQSILSSTSPSLFVIDDGSYDHVQDSSFKRDFIRVLNESIEDKLSRATSKMQSDDKLNQILYEERIMKNKSDNLYLRMLRKRKRLPSYAMKDQVLKLINDNQIVVISGETGCGKTTQVAQFILDDFIEKGKGSLCRILCTQPRRISAISVAERVAEERAEFLCDSVGYQIRLEKRFPRERGSILFCTTGIVLKLMETNPSLSTISHLILDEIHERDVLSDFILALIKKIIVKRKDLKVVLMSATLNADKFSKYYDDAPHINIPGFTFPVEEYFLEDVIEKTSFVFDQTSKGGFKKRKGRIQGMSNYDAEFSSFIEPHIRQLEAEKKYSRSTLIQLRNPSSEEVNLDLIMALLIHICQKDEEGGAILVFLTGFGHISSLIQLLEQSGSFSPDKFLIFPLHSLMPTLDQKQIFETPPPGKRKIIVATNIAETSITIDDVVFVVDCGKIKMTNFDVKSNSETLAPEWVSLANANQRKGRAGRVKPGVCFHLYSRARHMILEQYQKPEILRKRLEDVILTAKVLQLGKIEFFFECLLDSPNPEAVAISVDLLKQLNALTDDENLTPLGYHLAKLPVAPQIGKMILFGAIFSCLDPVLSVAVSLDFKDAFQIPVGKEKEADRKKRDLAGNLKSDHLLYHEALTRFEECGRNYRSFCWNYFLSSSTLKLLQSMKRQFMGYLNDMNFVNNSDPKCYEFNKNSHNLSLIKAIVCAGLYPNVLFTHRNGKAPTFTPNMNKVNIHPKSVLAEEKLYFDTNLLVYYRKVKSTSDFIHDGSLVHPLPVIFFGDNFTQVCDQGHNMIIVNKKLKFKCSENNALLIKELRDRFNWFLEHKISHPGPVIWNKSNEDIKVIQVIMDLITCEDMGYFEDEDFEDD